MVSFQTPGRVFAGLGSVSRIPFLVNGKSRIGLLTDKGIRDAGICNGILASLTEDGRKIILIDSIPAEPSVDVAVQIIKDIVDFDPEELIAVGGGSVMDIAKLCSLFGRDVDYTLEMLVDKPDIAKKHFPTIMVPTTAGTGAEVTRNAILAFPDKMLKIGIVSSEMTADVVILDADMTATVPAPVAAAACADSLAHAIECYTSAKATPLSDMYSMEALRLIFDNAIGGCIHNEPSAREALQLAAYYGGCAISSSGTTAVHALSYPLGGRFHIAHGVANAILLMPVMRFNEPCCVKRFASICDRLNPSMAACGERDKSKWLLHQMELLIRDIGIPTGLSSFGVGKENLDWLVQAGLQVKRLLDNNPRPVNSLDAKNIYEQVL